MGRPEARTLGNLLDELAESAPDAPALIFQDRTYTFGDFRQRTDSLAMGLLRLGIRKGAHVAVLMGNRPEWLLADFACAKIGATLVGVNTWFRRKELEYVLTHSNASVLVLADRMLGNDYVDTLAEICPELARPSSTPLRSARLPALRWVICLGEARLAGMLSFEDVVDLGARESVAALRDVQHTVGPKDVANILYTSGTTAFPKGIMLAHGDLIANGFDIGERQHLTERDRLWLGVPLFFSLASANAVMAVLTHGGSIALQEYFQSEEAMRIIQEHRCTVFYGMPNMVQAMEADPKRGAYDLSSLRTGVTIGPPESIRRAAELGPERICNVYGMTETYGNCAVTDANEPLETRMHSQGAPLPGMDIRIVDPEPRRRDISPDEPDELDENLAPGEIGEIRVTGYVTPGYYNDEALTRETFDEHGYLRTGDLGYLDGDNRLHYVGRSKDMIKTGGINVSPLEVEALLVAHDKVQQAHVLGVPDPVKDEIVVAVVELSEGEEASEEEIRSYCRDRVASYKIPVHVVFVRDRDLPRTATGKIQKNVLTGQVEKRIRPGIR